jgi:membrane associated rhomboid family serine protease
MRSELEPSRSRSPVVRRVGAGLILLAAAALAIHLVIGLVVSVFWIAAVLAAIVAVFWALKTIVW